MKLNNRGQALLESAVTLPLIITALGGLLFCFYSVTSSYLVNHWVYQSNLCLAKQESPIICKKELLKKVKLIPFAKLKLMTFYRGPKSTLVFLKTVPPSLLKINIQEKLRLPIVSEDFKRFD